MAPVGGILTGAPCFICHLSNRKGSIIVSSASAIIHLVLLVVLLFIPEIFSDIFDFPRPALTVSLSMSSMGFLLSLLLLLGSCQIDMPVCIPFLFYDGLCVALNVVILLFAGTHGLPMKNPEASKFCPLIVLFVILGVHVYAFWVALAFVLEMRYAKSHHYEQVRSLESMTTQRKGSRSPVFKIPDENGR